MGDGFLNSGWIRQTIHTKARSTNHKSIFGPNKLIVGKLRRIKCQSNTTGICVTFCMLAGWDGCLGVRLGEHVPESPLFFLGFSIVRGLCCVTVICFSGIQPQSSQNLPLPWFWLQKYCTFTGWSWAVFRAAIGGLVRASWPHFRTWVLKKPVSPEC